MTVQCYVTVADPDFDLRRGLGFNLLATASIDFYSCKVVEA